MTANQAAVPNERLKVFVSYSRTDIDFSDQLVLALEDKGFEALVDRHDIDAAEKWKDRLGALIEACDTVVFVLSEKSASSPICAWEVQQAAQLNKRIIPVVPHDPAGVAPPPQLSELNYILFYKSSAVPGSGFYDGVQKLERALKVNLGWLRRQTHYAEQAALWAADKSDDRVLGGKPLEEALQWRAETPKDAIVSPIVLEYIRASETCDARRKAEADANIAQREAALRSARRFATFMFVVLGVLVVVSGGAAWLWGNLQDSNVDRERLAQQTAELSRQQQEYAGIATRRDEVARMRDDLAQRIEILGRTNPRLEAELTRVAQTTWLAEDRRIAAAEGEQPTYPTLVFPGPSQSEQLVRRQWEAALDREVAVLRVVTRRVEQQSALSRSEEGATAIPGCENPLNC